MFLSYLALAILVIVIVVVVYAFIWVHDIPYRMAKKRNHPNLHAIHIACWLSLFTLHALRPFVFIWAIAQKHEGRSVADVVAARPTAAYDAKWGRFLINGESFTKLVYRGIAKT